MATANFGRPNLDLPLMVGGMSECEEQNEMEYEDAKYIVEETNKELHYFEMELEAGYYEGFMFNVKEDDYLDYDDIGELTDDDAMYYYGDTADNVRKDMADELEKIKKVLQEWKENGGLELIKVAQFPNGEAMYKSI